MWCFRALLQALLHKWITTCSYRYLVVSCRLCCGQEMKRVSHDGDGACSGVGPTGLL